MQDEAKALWLSDDDVSEMLGIGKTSVQRMAKRGEIPSVQFGQRMRRFYKPEVDKWLRERITRRQEASQQVIRYPDKGRPAVKPGRNITFGVRLDEHQVELLDQMADDFKVSRSAVVRRVLQMGFDFMSGTEQKQNLAARPQREATMMNGAPQKLVADEVRKVMLEFLG